MIQNVKSPTEMSALYFVYNGATSLEKKGWYGLTHVMEHLFCKNYDDMQNELQENGIEWNAWTSENQVVVYFTGLEKYFAPFRDELIERSKTFRATPADVEKEKKIVLEEYSDYFTDQTETHHLNYMRRRYGAYTAIGLKGDIEQFTHQDCVAFFALQYAQPDSIISVAQHFELVRPDLHFTDRLGLLRNDWQPASDAPLEDEFGKSDKTSLIYECPVGSADVPVLMFLNELMGGGLNSPLLDEIRERQGLVYDLNCHCTPLGSLNVQRIYTMTSNENVNKFEAALKKVLNQRDAHLTPARVEMVRKYLQIRREKEYINRYMSVDALLSLDAAAAEARLDTVTIADLSLVYDKYFNFATYERSCDQSCDQS